MTELDLDRLGDVWRQRPDPKELEELRHAAERVRRRARWLQAIDIVAALVVGGVVLVLVLSNPQVDTMLVGGAAIFVLLYGQIRSRRFRQKELQSLTGSTEQMLDQSIERVRATLVRARSGLILLPVAFVLGVFVASVTLRSSERDLAERIAGDPRIAQALLVAAVAALAIGVVHLIRSIRRSREELEKLESLRLAYREEQESSAEE